MYFVFTFLVFLLLFCFPLFWLLFLRSFSRDKPFQNELLKGICRLFIIIISFFTYVKDICISGQALASFPTALWWNPWGFKERNVLWLGLKIKGVVLESKEKKGDKPLKVDVYLLDDKPCKVDVYLLLLLLFLSSKLFVW